MRTIKSILCIILWCPIFAAWSQVYKPILIGKQQEWPLINTLYHFSSAEPLSPQHAYRYLQKHVVSAITSEHLSKGYDANYEWFYLKLLNDKQAKTIFLTFKRADIHRFYCFRKKGEAIDTIAVAGDAFPFAIRPIPINTFAVPIPLNTAEKVELLVFIDKRFEFIEDTPKLYSSSQFYRISRYEFGLHMSYLGVIVFLAIFNIFLHRP